MGSLLLCGGEKGERRCLPHSSIMIHQPSGGYSGQASDIKIHAEEIIRVRKALNEIYRTHLTRRGEDGKVVPEEGRWTLDEIEFVMERDKFLSAEDALKLGIVDEILDRRGKPQDV